MAETAPPVEEETLNALRNTVQRSEEMFASSQSLRLPPHHASTKVRVSRKYKSEYKQLEAVSQANTAAAAFQTAGSAIAALAEEAKRAREDTNTEESSTAKRSHVSLLVDELSGGGITASLQSGSQAIVPVAGSTARPEDLQVAVAPGHAPSQRSIMQIRRREEKPKAKWHPQWKLHRVISGHQGWVRCIDVDPANKFFATGSNDRMIKIWDLASGTLKLSLTGHIHNIRAVKLHDRLTYMFSAGEDNMVKCWDLETNKVIRSYHGHLSGVYSLDFHPSLDVLFTGSRDATCRVWDIRTKTQVHALAGHNNTVCAIASQSTEPQLVTGSFDCTARLWDLAAGKCFKTLTHHKKSVRSLTAHRQAQQFLTCGADHIKVWDNGNGIDFGHFSRNIDGHHSVVLNAAALREEGETGLLACGGDNGSIYLWDYASGQKFQEIEGRPQPGSLSAENAIYGLTFDRSGSRLLTAECDKTIKIYKEEEGGQPAH